MKEQIQVKYDPETKEFRELNPLGKTETSGGFWYSREAWHQAELKLRSFKLPDEAEREIKCEEKYNEASQFFHHSGGVNPYAFKLGFNSGFNAEKEMRPFSKEDMVKFAQFNYRQQKTQPQFTAKDNLNFYIESITYQPDKIYTVEVEGDRITKIVEA